MHYNITDSPSAQWVMTQLRDAFPFDTASKYLIFDRGSAFNPQVEQLLRDMGTKPKVTGYRCPWQNGVAERFVLSVRVELLDHVIIFDENNLRDHMHDYVDYYNSERCHLSVCRDSPDGREIMNKSSESAKVIAHPRFGGLHHVYKWDKAA